MKVMSKTVQIKLKSVDSAQLIPINKRKWN